MFSKRNFGLTDSLIEVSKKVSEDYQEKVKGLMAKMGIKSLKDLSPEEKKKFFNKLDDMHTAKHEEVDLDEAVLRGRDFKYDEKRSRVLITKQNFKKAGKDSTSMSGGIPKMMVLSKNKGTVLAPVEFTDQKKIDAFKEEVGLDENMYTYTVVHVKKGKEIVKASSSYAAAKKFAQMKGLKSTSGVDAHLMKEEDDLDEAKEARIVFRYKTQADNYVKKMGGRVKKVGHLFYVVKEEVELDEKMGKDDSKSLAVAFKKLKGRSVMSNKSSTGGTITRPKKGVIKHTAKHEEAELDEKNFGKPNQPDHYRHMGRNPLQPKKVKNERTLTPDEEEKKEKIVMSLKDKAADFEKRYPGKGKQVMYAVATKMAKKD